jgi:2-phosphosulfolactate phosphatase
LPLSAEARIARDAFLSARLKLAETIRDCLSGRELIDKGFPQDVELAVQLDVSLAAPVLRDGAYRDGGVQADGSK